MLTYMQTIETLISSLAHAYDSQVMLQSCPQISQGALLDTSASPKFFPFPLATTCSSPMQAKQGKWSGFKIVIDNIRVNLRPWHQTFVRQTKSIHYLIHICMLYVIARPASLIYVRIAYLHYRSSTVSHNPVVLIAQAADS